MLAADSAPVVLGANGIDLLLRLSRHRWQASAGYIK
ncbi:hypothetical protein HMPREF1250_0124, partial [Megasphaera vaginalis (ex Srinivasan et al. 2021)]